MDTLDLLNTYKEQIKSTKGIGLWQPEGSGIMHQRENPICQGHLRLNDTIINIMRR